MPATAKKNQRKLVEKMSPASIDRPINVRCIGIRAGLKFHELESIYAALNKGQTVKIKADSIEKFKAELQKAYQMTQAAIAQRIIPKPKKLKG
jgi:hypothetical protein